MVWILMPMEYTQLWYSQLLCNSRSSAMLLIGLESRQRSYQSFGRNDR